MGINLPGGLIRKNGFDGILVKVGQILSLLNGPLDWSLFLEYHTHEFQLSCGGVVTSATVTTKDTSQVCSTLIRQSPSTSHR